MSSYQIKKYNTRVEDYPSLTKFDIGSVTDTAIQKRRDELEYTLESNSRLTVKTYNELQDLLDELESSLD